MNGTQGRNADQGLFSAGAWKNHTQVCVCCGEREIHVRWDVENRFVFSPVHALVFTALDVLRRERERQREAKRNIWALRDGDGSG